MWELTQYNELSQLQKQSRLLIEQSECGVWNTVNISRPRVESQIWRKLYGTFDTQTRGRSLVPSQMYDLNPKRKRPMEKRTQRGVRDYWHQQVPTKRTKETGLLSERWPCASGARWWCFSRRDFCLDTFTLWVGDPQLRRGIQTCNEVLDGRKQLRGFGRSVTKIIKHIANTTDVLQKSWK